MPDPVKPINPATEAAPIDVLQGKSITVDQGVDALLSGLSNVPDGMPPNEPIMRNLRQTAADMVQGGEPKPLPPGDIDDSQKPTVQPVPGAKTPQSEPPVDDYIEWEADGQKHQVKLNDALEAYNDRESLNQRMQDFEQQQQVMPEQVEQVISAAMQARQALIAEQQQIQQVYVPQQPPQVLLDKQSPHYNPDRYAALLRDFNAGQAWLQQTRNSVAQHQAQLQQEQAVLHESMMARGRAQLMQRWPEVLTDERTRQDLADVLAHEGFDPRTALDTVTDPRAYGILRLAIEGLAARRARKQTAQVVRLAPRLVRGAGKRETNAGGASPEAMQRIARTGNVEDAVDIVAGFLQSGGL